MNETKTIDLTLFQADGQCRQSSFPRIENSEKKSPFRGLLLTGCVVSLLEMQSGSRLLFAENIHKQMIRKSPRHFKLQFVHVTNYFGMITQQKKSPLRLQVGIFDRINKCGIEPLLLFCRQMLYR